MMPAARVQAAIEVLDQVLDGHPAEQALTRWARASRYAGSKDRAAVRDHVFQALRCRRSYAASGGGETGRGLMLGALRADGIPEETVFTGERYAPAPLTEEERAPGHPDDKDLWDLPGWLISRFEQSLGEEAFQAAQLLRTRAPVTVRVNLRKADPATAIAQLAEAGITAQPARRAATALLLTDGARRLAQSAPYLEGMVELQDASSQAAMERLTIPEDARVLDYCAGGGGKTLALAARADAHWFAHDALPQRLKDVPSRAARAGVTVHLLGSEEVATVAPFDLILCDVPCSGSGTWRRAPEAKWRLTPDALKDLQATQARILGQSAGLVTPDGALAYATCSVLQEENEAQIEAFVAANQNWSIQSQERLAIDAEGDGFYLAILQRVSR